MTPKGPKASGHVLLNPQQIGLLIKALIRRGYQVIGPTIRDGAIVYDEVASVEDLPKGWTDVQQAGKYALKKRSDGALFGYNAGPHAWKKFLFPSQMRLWKALRTKNSFQIVAEEPKAAKVAFVGVRACELQAMGIQDKVLLEGCYADPSYKARRKDIFIVAVNCTQAGGTCFCESMGTGPHVGAGYDIALTELINGQHTFVTQAGSRAGAQLLADLPSQEAGEGEVNAAHAAVDRAAQHMGRTLQTNGLKELLYRNAENPRWDTIATRCLSCANCTMVCPTCFCSTIEDVTDLGGQEADRIRKWDSCFVTDFSYIHGGSVRATVRSKFRQWMMHKLAYWNDQFRSSGCVGCGRCITWCPVGIDITEEARALREWEVPAGTAV